jgi:formylglycine-generating enzyme required for sulfatase activity
LANSSISLEGIDQAIADLNYRSGSVKQKAVMAIRSFYSSDETIKGLNSIDTDSLIKRIWDVGDNFTKIKSKRRNFTSLRSSINTDLKKLLKKDKNPDNIIIADSNIFDLTQEAKDDLLGSFADAFKKGDVDLDQAASLLETMTEFLDQMKSEGNDTGSQDIADKIKKILDKITKEVLSDDGEGTAAESGESGESGGALEEIELDEDEELEEIDEDIEEVALDDDEELEEIEDTDEDIEDVDDDVETIEVDDDEEIEEVDDLDEDIEEIEINEDDDLEEIEEVDEDEDIEEVELDEDEELEEIDGLDDDVEEIELDEDEDVEEIELDEDEELEDVDELDEEEQKALEEFREQKELSEQFDQTLGERERKYNKYTKVPTGLYTVGTKKGIKSTLELQQFDMPEVYIGIYPVINSLFEIFIEETGYITTAEKLGFGRVYYSRFKKDAKGSTWNKNSGSEDVKGACWYQPSGPDSSLHGKRSHPVVQVSIDDAFTFASWIGRRIPTEAEWESAARTDLGFKYPWGNEFNQKALNLEQSGLSDTSSVDEYDTFANEFKIIDMLGNVMEWTSDMEAPPFKSKQNTKYCVAKGGAWNGKDDITISSRVLFKLGFTSNTIGFRCISEIFL